MTMAVPMNVLTDYLLAGLATGFAVLLWRKAGHTSQRFWVVAFVAAALAALLGGSWHGFHDRWPPVVTRVMWRMTTAAIGLSGLFLLLGCLRAELGKPWRDWFSWLAVGKFLLYLAVVNRSDSYAIVIAEYAPNLLAVLAISLLRVKVSAAARWSIAGVLVACAAAAAQYSGLSLHSYFNHNDLYHLVQAVSFGLFFRAGLLLGDRRIVPSAQ